METKNRIARRAAAQASKVPPLNGWADMPNAQEAEDAAKNSFPKPVTPPKEVPLRKKEPIMKPLQKDIPAKLKKRKEKEWTPSPFSRSRYIA